MPKGDRGRYWENSSLSPNEQLSYAASENNPEGIKRLLPNVDRTTLSRMLHVAASAGATQSFEALVQAGASVDNKDEQGFTPLQTATRFGHTELVQMAVKYGANVNTANNFGRTPLHSALRHRRQDTIKYLLSVPGINTKCVDLKNDPALPSPSISAASLTFQQHVQRKSNHADLPTAGLPSTAFRRR